uniref:Uncharacterized protein n=1 Tax=Arundo donax TaxID=35708 RepID=A0A0A9H4B7_ARUDO
MYPARHHLAIVVCICRLNHTPVDKLIKIALCNILRICPVSFTYKTFSYPFPSQIILVDGVVFWINTQI